MDFVANFHTLLILLNVKLMIDHEKLTFVHHKDDSNKRTKINA